MNKIQTVICFVVLAFLCTTVNCGFNIFFLSGFKKSKLKNEILSLSRKMNRGLKSSEQDANRIRSLFNELEALNSNKDTLLNPSLNGTWTLEYTSSKEIVGSNRKTKLEGEILQILNIPKLRAENSEMVSVLGSPAFKSSVTANLKPLTTSRASVQFDRFGFGPIHFPAPRGYTGYIDVTYLDRDFRLTRGDKGNIFILTKKF